ncbi:MAG: GntR family transcriptional regulator [Betaproteobacteria bacterium]
MDKSTHAITLATTQLEEDILFGRLRPRERLIEDELIERLKTSRHVVRQALAELERMGMAVRIPNKGAIVRDFSRDEIGQISEVREILNAKAASLISLPADAALLQRMEKLQRQHTAAVKQGDPARIHQANNAFHEELFAACGNTYLAQTIRDYAQLSLAFRCHLMTNPSHAERARDEHLAMISALKTGDRKELSRLCVEHIRPSQQVYIALQGWSAGPSQAAAVTGGKPVPTRTANRVRVR